MSTYISELIILTAKALGVRTTSLVVAGPRAMVWSTEQGEKDLFIYTGKKPLIDLGTLGDKVEVITLSKDSPFLERITVVEKLQVLDRMSALIERLMATVDVTERNRLLVAVGPITANRDVGVEHIYRLLTKRMDTRKVFTDILSNTHVLDKETHLIQMSVLTNGDLVIFNQLPYVEYHADKVTVLGYDFKYTYGENNA